MGEDDLVEVAWTAVAGGRLLAKAPLAALRKVVGVFLLGMIAWRHVGRQTQPPWAGEFAAVGAMSGFGSALIGSWCGKRSVDRLNDRVFVVLVEAGLVVAGLLFPFGVA